MQSNLPVTRISTFITRNTFVCFVHKYNFDQVINKHQNHTELCFNFLYIFDTDIDTCAVNKFKSSSQGIHRNMFAFLTNP